MSEKKEKRIRSVERQCNGLTDSLAASVESNRVLARENEALRSALEVQATDYRLELKRAERRHREAVERCEGYRVVAVFSGLTVLATILVAAIALASWQSDAKAAEVPDPAPVEEVVETVEANENQLIEEAILSGSHRIDNVTVTHYCTCSVCCGKSDGITASGRMATPGVSVAVDTSIIPLGADVLIDWGDGEYQYCRADDTGSAIKGNHIDLCMENHQEALKAGVKTATVYWCKEG